MVGDREHEDRSQGGGAPSTEDDFENVLSRKTGKSGLRERGGSQAPPIKRRRERDRSPDNTNRERTERSLEVEREGHQKFQFTSFKTKSKTNKSCSDKGPGRRISRKMTRPPPNKIENSIKNHFTPRRNEPEARREISGGRGL